MAEANELFDGWADDPPANLLLKAIIEGFAGKKTPKVATVEDAEQLALDSGGLLPISRRPDPTLPVPSFDIDFLRQRNAEVILKSKGKGQTNG